MVSKKPHRVYRSLRAYKNQRRLTLRELASMLEVSESAVSLYCRGERVPEPAIALRIHRLCNVALESLLSRAS